MGAGAEAEAIVVGGGPAGAATAIGLARRGRRVLLLEGRDFARRPVPRAAEMRSGEVLSPGSQRELRRLGLPLDGADWRFTPFATLHQRWPNGRRTLDRLPAGLEFWQTDRGRLDRALFALARAAGADARDGCRVRGVLREGRDGGGSAAWWTTRGGPGARRSWWTPAGDTRRCWCNSG